MTLKCRGKKLWRYVFGRVLTSWIWIWTKFLRYRVYPRPYQTAIILTLRLDLAGTRDHWRTYTERPRVFDELNPNVCTRKFLRYHVVVCPHLYQIPAIILLLSYPSPDHDWHPMSVFPRPARCRVIFSLPEWDDVVELGNYNKMLVDSLETTYPRHIIHIFVKQVRCIPYYPSGCWFCSCFILCIASQHNTIGFPIRGWNKMSIISFT